MKRSIFYLAAVVLAASACQEKGNGNEIDPETDLYGEITEDRVLAAGNTYNLTGGLHVKEGATLTIAHGLMAYDNLDDALEAAARSGKRVFVDITGHGCVNCREMEQRVWSDPRVLESLRDDFVIAALYVDDKTKLPESEWVLNDSGKPLKDIGRVNSYIALKRFGVNSQPNYFILDSDGGILKGPRAYDLDVEGYLEFLSE